MIFKEGDRIRLKPGSGYATGGWANRRYPYTGTVLKVEPWKSGIFVKQDWNKAHVSWGEDYWMLLEEFNKVLEAVQRRV